MKIALIKPAERRAFIAVTTTGIRIGRLFLVAGWKRYP